MVNRPRMGRKKIMIKEIENQDARQVCFSKRRAGLMKKASELCILCGAEIAILVFSPGGKVYTFGHPCIESVIHRYLRANSSSEVFPDRCTSAPDPCRLGRIEDLKRQHEELLRQIESEKQRRFNLEAVAASQNCNGRFWWEADVENLPVEQLEPYGAALEELRKNVAKRADELLLKMNDGDPAAGAGAVSVGAALGSVVGDGGGGGASNALVVGPPLWRKHGGDLMGVEGNLFPQNDFGRGFFYGW